MPNSGDLGIIAQIDFVAHNKECSQFSIVDDSFNMLFLIRNRGRGRGEVINRCRIGPQKTYCRRGKTLQAMKEEMDTAQHRMSYLS